MTNQDDDRVEAAVAGLFRLGPGAVAAPGLRLRADAQAVPALFNALDKASTLMEYPAGQGMDGCGGIPF